MPASFGTSAFTSRRAACSDVEPGLVVASQRRLVERPPVVAIPHKPPLGQQFVDGNERFVASAQIRQRANLSQLRICRSSASKLSVRS